MAQSGHMRPGMSLGWIICGKSDILDGDMSLGLEAVEGAGYGVSGVGVA